MSIIAFIGFKGTGKSTAAEYLEDNYGFVRHNFKDALIAEIKEKFPDLLREIIEEVKGSRGMFMDTSHLTIDWLFENKPPLIRALMQNYGTEVRRAENPDYWVNRWYESFPDSPGVVTDDTRFINESQAVREKGGILIRLTRPDIPTGGDHKSETEQLEIVADHTITVGPGEHEELYRELDRIMNGV